MKVKMAEVARYLGISKATVSLAVNGKPGVNPQTRERIFRCIEEMEKNGGMMPEEIPRSSSKSPKLIKVVIINRRKQVVCDPEMDLWSGVLRTFDVEARKQGYVYGVSYLNEGDDEEQRIIEECNLDIVAGILLFATEMTAEDTKILQQIHKPLVIYDYKIPNGEYSSICVDNRQAVKLAVDQLTETGVREIRYLGTTKQIYNFEQRREAFQETLLKQDISPKKDDIILLGSSIGEITEQAIEYLTSNPLPQAFVLENYQVSIGVLTAIRKLRIQVPEKLKLVGIDEIPEYVLSDFKLTQISIPHEERAAMAIELLSREIEMSWKTKIRLFAIPELIHGDSV